MDREAWIVMVSVSSWPKANEAQASKRAVSQKFRMALIPEQCESHRQKADSAGWTRHGQNIANADPSPIGQLLGLRSGVSQQVQLGTGLLLNSWTAFPGWKTTSS